MMKLLARVAITLFVNPSVVAAHSAAQLVKSTPEDHSIDGRKLP